MKTENFFHYRDIYVNHATNLCQKHSVPISIGLHHKLLIRVKCYSYILQLSACLAAVMYTGMRTQLSAHLACLGH